MRPPQLACQLLLILRRVEKTHSWSIKYVGATIGRPPTWRSNAFSGYVFFTGKRARESNARPYKSFLTVCILIVRLFDQPDLLPDLKRLAAKTELPSGDRDAGRQRSEHCAKNAFQIVFFMVKAIPHNSKRRYGERGAADAKPNAQIILDAAKVSAASGGYSEPKQGQRSQSARGFCPRSTMRVPQPDIVEHFGNADAVPQPPERCLSRKAGIVRCCLKSFLSCVVFYR